LVLDALAPLVPHLCPEPLADHLRTVAEGDVVVVVGGDGTISRVLNTPRHGRLTLAIVPVGTANDLAASAGIPADPHAACRIVAAGVSRCIDLVEVNGRVFATSGGLGVPTEVASCANRWKSRGVRLGKLVYLLAAGRVASRPWAGTPIELRVDGQVHRLDASALLVGNQARTGGLFRVLPRARDDDGWLDLLALGALAAGPARARALAAALLGRLERIQGAVSFRAKRVRIRAAQPLEFFGDGELLVRGRLFNMRVWPGALRLLVPAPAH
jgi:YegS/Rv2252/BmrU family lipid kinase